MRMYKILICCVLCASTSPLFAQTPSPIASGKSKFLGSVHSTSQLTGFESYWNQVTPENAGKWGSVEATRDSYNWGPLDQAYEFAHANGFPFRYHVLLWGNQQPSWIEDLSAEEQLAEITEWMDTVAARYPDIDYLEVVNEPINDPPNGDGNGNYMQALGGFGVTGYDWILEAYRMARERFPGTKLVINEYNIVSSVNNTNKYIRMINFLKDEELVDVIGVQAHAFSTTGTALSIRDNLDALADLGLPLMATEFDIDGPTDEEQVEAYQRIFPVFWEHPSVIGVTLWGFRPGMWRSAQKAYLIDTDGSERPALTWLRSYVESYDPDAIPLGTPAGQGLAVYPNPIVDGVLRISGKEAITEVEVYSLSGLAVARFSPQGVSRFEESLHQPPGVYMVRITTQHSTRVQKIIVR